MSISPLAPRILALPADVRAALARVDGPGWLVHRDVHDMIPVAMEPCNRWIWRPDNPPGDRFAWWSANPAASVAAVLGCPIYTAHYRLYQADATGDDHAAALTIIEAHVANRGPS